MRPPLLALAGFERIHLGPGEKRRLRFTLGPRELSEVDAKGVRRVQPGSYKLYLGGAQPSEHRSQSLEFSISGKKDLSR